MTDSRWTLDRYTVDRDARRLSQDGVAVDIGARPFDLLLALIEHRDRVVSHDELLRLVWGRRVVQPANLHVQIGALRRAIGADAIATVPGQGYRLVARLAPVRAERRSGASGLAPAAAASLPPALTPFVGRRDELAACRALLDSARLLTLTGIGGTGKTRLAVQLAVDAATALGSVRFVDVVPVREGADLARLVVAAFERRDAHGSPRDLAVVARALAGQDALLLLDNCEHLLEECGRCVAELLRLCPSLRVLATSREPLKVAGEQLFGVPSLALQAGSGGGPLSESAQVFGDAARRIVPTFAIDAGNAARVESICRRLDGLPLAIELAAAQVRMLPVDDIDARLRHDLRLLVNPSRADPRHQTMTATLGWSFDRLSPLEQRLLERLSVFVGRFGLAAASRVGDVDEDAALAALTGLRDRSLLRADAGRPEDGRYSLLEPVRQFALARLAASGQAADARARHAAHVVGLAESRPSMSIPDWMTLMQSQQGNLVAAQEESLDDADDRNALRLCAALVSYWVNTGQADRGLAHARAALRPGRDGAGTLLRKRALGAAAALAMHGDELVLALGWSADALALAQPFDDEDEEAMLVETRTHALREACRGDEALCLVEAQCLEARRRGARRMLGRLLSTLGDQRSSARMLDAAADAYEESLGIAREVQHPIGWAVALNDLAAIDIARGDPAGAAARLLESVAVARRSAIHRLNVRTLQAIAGLASSRGDHPRAGRWFGCAASASSREGRQPYKTFAPGISRDIARSRAAGCAAAFAQAAAEGEALRLDDALDEATGWLGAIQATAPPSRAGVKAGARRPQSRPSTTTGSP